MSDITIKATVKVTAINDADLDSIHDDFKAGLKDLAFDCDQILTHDQSTVEVTED